jgi:hypothetical protein
MSLHPDIVASYKEALTMCENWAGAAQLVQADVALKTSQLGALEAEIARLKQLGCEYQDKAQTLKRHVSSCHIMLQQLKRYMVLGNPWATRSVNWATVAQEIDKLTATNNPPNPE